MAMASPRWLRVSRLLAPLLSSVFRLPVSYAAPLLLHTHDHGGDIAPKHTDDPELWIYLGTAVALVLLGGVFAGLTIALMGQDEIFLQVTAQSGDGAERKHAKKVLRLLKKGKHWVLVSLLLGNVITNETLPIVLDRSLGGGWPAVVSSTVLIVIFGEIAPQSVCVRYGLPIGAWMSPLVLALMWILSPVAWPTAKLLDYLLGEDHGTTYKKTGLKTLVSLHRTMGESAQRLNQDEVTIISAVLDLKDKMVGDIMTPIADVFTLSLDTVLDEAMMDKILAEGYSRIPIYAVNNPRDFVGMLLVKMLITYDPEDCARVRDFQLATLPETRKETSCLDIVNFFQEGKSHMVLVSDYPGEPRGALGVLTLEDVIEELIGEEIVDESDVYIDVRRGLKRMKPAPFSRVKRVEKGEVVTDADPQVPNSQLEGELEEGRRSRRGSDTGSRQKAPATDQKPPQPVFFRRKSNGGEAVVRSDAPEMVQHFRSHLGPSNLASRPKSTRIGTVTIKPGVPTMGTVPETEPATFVARPVDADAESLKANGDPEANEASSLLSAGLAAKDGTHALSYGAVQPSPTAKTHDIPVVVKAGSIGGQSHNSSRRQSKSPHEVENPRSSTSPESTRLSQSRLSESLFPPPKLVLDLTASQEDLTHLDASRQSSANGPLRSSTSTTDVPTSARRGSTSTLGSLHSFDAQASGKPRLQARSGSITEQIIEVGGVKKIVLETTSSSDDDMSLDDANAGVDLGGSFGYDRQGDGIGDGKGAAASEGGPAAAKKKRRKKRAGAKKRKPGDENTPLLA